MKRLSECLPGSDTWSGRWPKRGIGMGGTVFELPKRALHIAESGSSWSEYYPTPSATPYGSSQNEGQVPYDRPSRGTPSLETWAKGWPTPTARVHKGGAEWSNRKRDGDPRRASDMTLADAGEAWPTATVGDSRNSRNSTANDGRGSTGNPGTTLSDAATDWPKEKDMGRLLEFWTDQRISEARALLPGETDNDYWRRQPPIQVLERLGKTAEWPTPTSAEKGSETMMRGNLTLKGAVTRFPNGENWSTPTAQDHRATKPGNERPGTLREDAQELFPRSLPGLETPPPGAESSRSGDGISCPRSQMTNGKARLNPKFCAWLMGWLTATELTACDSSETESSRSKRPSRSESC